MGIIQNFKKLKSVWSWKRIIGNIGYFIKTDFNKLEFEMTYKIKDEVIEECAYELEDYKNHLTTLQVLDSNETVKMLANYPKSFSRFGDGEIKIMQGKDQPFQKYDPVLAEKMFDILKNKRDDMYVGLNKAYFQSPSDFAERNRKFYRVYGTEYPGFLAIIVIVQIFIWMPAVLELIFVLMIPLIMKVITIGLKNFFVIKKLL